MTPLHDLHELDAALLRAQSEPIVIFKHSPSCGVSAQASEDIAEMLNTTVFPLPLYVVSVRAQREVSDAITRRFGIRHESPQVLLVHGNAVLWHASHFRVSAPEIQAAIQRLVTPATR
jgi:bacillithiol system protein YtxJ